MLEPATTQKLQGLAMRWQDAWNRHDMDVIAASIAPDVDFVTVAGQDTTVTIAASWLRRIDFQLLLGRRAAGTARRSVCRIIRLDPPSAGAAPRLVLSLAAECRKAS